MRIDRLQLRNFKKFEDRTFEFPQPLSGPGGSFHVLIGENCAGKTTILDAAAVALGVWLERVPDSLLSNSRRRLAPDQKHLTGVAEGDRTQYRQASTEMAIHATGSILDKERISWGQSLAVGKKKISTKDSKQALALIESAYDRIRQGEKVLLPVIAYYGAGRAWLPHNQRKQMKAKANGPTNRWEAFYDCLNDRIRLSDLNGWFRSEAIERGNRGGSYRPGFEAVFKAAMSIVPGADNLFYDSDRDEVVLSINRELHPFSNLSAGQRSLFALVADIAIKMVTQNNYLLPPDRFGPDDYPLPQVLTETPGVILIDEIDIHLHPKWQRGVVESLKKIFPKIQFIVTTHSPFIVQSLTGDELINLEAGQSVPVLGKLSVEKIANGLMGVDRPDVGQKYEEMVEAAKDYLRTLDEAAKAPEEKLAEFEKKLAERIEPYADNPAFQAFLELKHAVKLGSKQSNGTASQQREE